MEKSILALGCYLAFNLSLLGQAREFEMKDGDTTYTMKKYVFCLYVSGENRSQSEEEAKAIQSAHMAHINDMALHHQLAVAGPLEGESEKRGILVFDLATTEEAEAIVGKDPAVLAGRLGFECHAWWAAKGSRLP